MFYFPSNDSDFVEDTLEFKISKVRLSNIERILEAIESNLPIMYVLVGLLQHEGTIEIIKAPKRDAPASVVASIRKSWPVRESSTYLKSLVTAIHPCCETLKYSILGAPSGGVDDVSRKGHFQRQLNEPHITRGLFYVSEIYDNIDTIFRGTPHGDANKKSQLEIPEVVSEAFSDVTKVLKELLNDGEIAAVEKKFQGLSLAGLRLLSASPGDIYSLHSEFCTAAEYQVYSDNNSTKEASGRHYRQALNIFELYCMKTLTNIHAATKRPAWVASSVRSNLFHSLGVFVDTLKVVVVLNSLMKCVIELM
jgi:hypothetical protein